MTWSPRPTNHMEGFTTVMSPTALSLKPSFSQGQILNQILIIVSGIQRLLPGEIQM